MTTTPGAWKTRGLWLPDPAGHPWLPLPLLVRGDSLTPDVLRPLPERRASFTPAHPLILAGLGSDSTLSAALSHPSWHLFSRCALSGFQCHKRGDRVCPVHVNAFWNASSGSLWFCSFRSGLRFLSPRRSEEGEAGGHVSVSICCFKPILATSKFPPSCFIFPTAFPGCIHVHSCFPGEFY